MTLAVGRLALAAGGVLTGVDGLGGEDCSCSGSIISLCRAMRNRAKASPTTENRATRKNHSTNRAPTTTTDYNSKQKTTNTKINHHQQQTTTIEHLKGWLRRVLFRRKVPVIQLFGLLRLLLHLPVSLALSLSLYLSLALSLSLSSL